MHFFLRLILPAIFLFAGINSTCALTLADALEIAAQHPVLKQHELNIAGRQYEIIDASAKGPDRVSITSENLGSGSGFDGLETTIEASFPLQNNARVRARRKLAEEIVELAKLDKIAARWLIMNHTSRAFHYALVTRDLVDKARDNIINSEKLLDAARVMVESGSVAEQEVYQAELVVKQAKLDAEAAQSDFADANAELAVAMGLETADEIDLTGSATAELEIQSIEELEKFVLASHPGVLSRQAEISRVKAGLKLLEADNKAVWSITTGARHLNDDGKNDFLIGIEAELPNRRDNRGSKRAAASDIERLLLEKANYERELRLKLQAAIQRFGRLKDQAKKIRDEILPGAWHLFELSLAGYQLGKTDQIVVLQAQKEYLGQRESYLQSLGKLYEAADSIESIAGCTARQTVVSKN